MSQPPDQQADPRATVLKEQTTSTSTSSTCPSLSPPPPPAYTPRSGLNPMYRLVSTHALTPEILARLSGSAVTAPRPTVGAEQHDCADSMSPISIRVNTTIRVNQSDNLVAISGPGPSEIASAIVGAIEHASSAAAGIPMIDGSGDPRPIRVAVDAGIEVSGSRNVVGKEDFLLEYLSTRGNARGGRIKRGRPSLSDSEDDRSEDVVASDVGIPAAKRSRST